MPLFRITNFLLYRTVSKDTVSRALSHFVFEIRWQDGKEYPPGSIHGIMCGVMRYLQDDCNRPDLNFFKEDNYFHHLRRCIDRQMQELSKKGVGLVKKRADPVEEAHEEKLHVPPEKHEEKLPPSSGALSMHDSCGLLTAVYFYVGKVFGLRSSTDT